MSSFPTPVLISGFVAAADLSAKRYTAVLLGASGVNVAGADEMEFLGFLQNAPASGAQCEIAVNGGGSKAIAAGNITAGDKLTTDASGHLVAITTGQTKAAVAIALTAAVDNDVFEVLVLDGSTHTYP
jgi:hypothetical protein